MIGPRTMGLNGRLGTKFGSSMVRSEQSKLTAQWWLLSCEIPNSIGLHLASWLRESGCQNAVTSVLANYEVRSHP